MLEESNESPIRIGRSNEVTQRNGHFASQEGCWGLPRLGEEDPNAGVHVGIKETTQTPVEVR